MDTLFYQCRQLVDNIAECYDKLTAFVGTYTKIGNCVTVSLWIQIKLVLQEVGFIKMVPPMTQTLFLRGLPYTANATWFMDSVNGVVCNYLIE